MKKILFTLITIAITSTTFAGVKKIYIGSHVGGTAQYVIQCTNGNSYSSINQRSNGFWYSYSSNMGDNYKSLSINEVASKKCG